jgi:hypothetical protein
MPAGAASVSAAQMEKIGDSRDQFAHIPLPATTL